MMQYLTVMNVAVVITIVAVLILAGYLLATIIWIRKVAIQSERLLSQMNTVLPDILHNIKRTSENVRVVSVLARENMEAASVLVHAIRDVGYAVNRVHGALREGIYGLLHGKGATWLMRLAQVGSDVRPVADTVKSRVYNKGGKSNEQS